MGESRLKVLRSLVGCTRVHRFGLRGSGSNAFADGMPSDTESCGGCVLDALRDKSRARTNSATDGRAQTHDA